MACQLTNEVNLADDGFQKVIYKKKSRKPQLSIIPKELESRVSDFTEESTIRRITEATTELRSTDLFDSVKALIKEGLSSLENPSISKIICFGIGKFGECTTARFQFALLLCLKTEFNVDVTVYDPIFNENDIRILNHFDIGIFEHNLEGKYKVVDKKTTLFYLPHCPKQLTNNLLWANWGLDLSHCVIIANSFDRIIESLSKKDLARSADYIERISPYVLELSIINTFKYYEVFNDTSIHVFPKLNIISPDLWTYNLEPKYSEEGREFIRGILNKLLT